MLIAAHADINSRSKDGFTAAQCAQLSVDMRAA